MLAPHLVTWFTCKCTCEKKVLSTFRWRLVAFLGFTATCLLLYTQCSELQGSWGLDTVAATALKVNKDDSRAGCLVLLTRRWQMQREAGPLQGTEWQHWLRHTSQLSRAAEKRDERYGGRKTHIKPRKVTDTFVSLTERYDKERRGTEMRKSHRQCLSFSWKKEIQGVGGGKVQCERMGELCAQWRPWLLLYSLSCWA